MYVPKSGKYTVYQIRFHGGGGIWPYLNNLNISLQLSPLCPHSIHEMSLKMPGCVMLCTQDTWGYDERTHHSDFKTFSLPNNSHCWFRFRSTLTFVCFFVCLFFGGFFRLWSNTWKTACNSPIPCGLIKLLLWLQSVSLIRPWAWPSETVLVFGYASL